MIVGQGLHGKQTNQTSDKSCYVGLMRESAFQRVSISTHHNRVYEAFPPMYTDVYGVYSTADGQSGIGVRISHCVSTISTNAGDQQVASFLVSSPLYVCPCTNTALTRQPFLGNEVSLHHITSPSAIISG